MLNARCKIILTFFLCLLMISFSASSNFHNKALSVPSLLDPPVMLGAVEGRTQKTFSRWDSAASVSE